MPGTRRFNRVDEDNAKVTIVVPKKIDRRLRVLAARQGQRRRSDGSSVDHGKAERDRRP
jgi:hypothetical protein